MAKDKRAISLKQKIFTIFLVAFFAVILGVAIYSNIRIARQRQQYNNRIEDLKKQIKDLEDKKSSLNRAVSQVGSKEYLEDVARKQFNLKAPGEEVVVIAKDGQKKEDSIKQDEAPKTDSKNPWNPLTWWDWIIGKK